MLDLEDSVNLFQRQPGRLHIEEIDNRQPGKVEYGEYDIEPPADRIDAFQWVSAVNIANGTVLPLPTGVMETTMYTQSQLVIIAMEAPLFRDRLELISEGYKNGMASQDRPC